MEWTIAVGVAALAALAVAAVAQDLFYGQFPRLERLFGVRSPLVGTLALLVVDAAIASVVIFAFRSTRGSLEFSALGFKMTGPSGPVVLWTAAFLLVAVATGKLLPLVAANDTSPTPADVLDRLSMESLLQQNRGSIERATAPLNCLLLDFVIGKQDSGTLTMDVYCGRDADSGRLKAGMPGGIDFQKLSVAMPQVNGELVSLLTPALRGKMLPRDTEELEHRYVTDAGTRYEPWQLQRGAAPQHP